MFNVAQIRDDITDLWTCLRFGFNRVHWTSIDCLLDKMQQADSYRKFIICLTSVVQMSVDKKFIKRTNSAELSCLHHIFLIFYAAICAQSALPFVYSGYLQVDVL